MKSIILSALFVIPTVLFGQFDRNKMPEASEAPKINIKDSEVFKTANGITVILSENHKLPKVSFSLITAGTPALEKEFTGLSEIAGSLVMSGTANNSKDELDAKIDYIGANLSADYNSIRLSCLSKHMSKGLELMSDVLLNANFPQSEVDRIKTQYESSLLSTQSDGASMARNAAAVSNFKNHPYGEIMTNETLANINRDAIVSFYQKGFTPVGSYMVVIGDITRADAEKAIATYFGTWEGKKPNTKIVKNKTKLNGNNVVFVAKPGAVQSVIKITYPMAITPKSDDYLKLRVLNAVLGGGVFSNRLMQNLREDKAYTYGCRSYIDVNDYGSFFQTDGNFRNDVTDSAIVQVLFELDRLTTEVVTDKELSITKSSMAGGFARSLESSSTVARFALNIIKNDLAADFYQTYLQQLDAITKEDLLEVAQKYYSASNVNIVVVGNEDVLPKLTQFDTDGEVTLLNAFGEPVKAAEKADVTADEVILMHVQKVTGTKGDLAACQAKIATIKTLKEEMSLTSAQIPFPMTSSRAFAAPNTSGEIMEGNGMVFQKSYFDGTQGSTTNMQTGEAELTEEEVAEKQKSQGLFPMANYVTTGMEYSLKGVEEKNGNKYYVIKTVNGDNEGFTYINVETLLIDMIVSVAATDDGSQTVTITMSDYRDFDGFLFPTIRTIDFGQAVIESTVTARSINGTIDWSKYQ